MFDPCIAHQIRIEKPARKPAFLSSPSGAWLRHNRSMSSPTKAIAGRTALVLDSPHSGVDYPDDFGHSCEVHVLRQAEDTHVEKLYDFAPQMGAAWIEALFPRSYL